MWPPTPPAAPPTRPPRPEGLASEGVVAVLTALFVTFRLITPARPPLAKPAPNPAAPPFPPPPLALTWVELLLRPPPKWWLEKFLKAADALGRNHGLGQHTAAGVSYIDTQACHERVNFLRYLQKAYRTHEPRSGHCRKPPPCPQRPPGLALLPRRWQRPAGRTGRIGLQPSARGTNFLESFKAPSLQRERIGNKRANHAREQAQAPGVHNQQKNLPAQHPAPGFPNVRCGLACAHRKATGAV